MITKEKLHKAFIKGNNWITTLLLTLFYVVMITYGFIGEGNEIGRYISVVLILIYILFIIAKYKSLNK